MMEGRRSGKRWGKNEEVGRRLSCQTIMGEATGKGSCAYWLLLGSPVKAAKSRDVVLMP